MSEADPTPTSGDVLRAQATDQIIERFGGIRPMAAKLGIPATTVQGWKKRGSIPEGRTPELITAAGAHAITLTPAEIAAATAPEMIGTRMNLEDLEREIAAAPAAKPVPPPPPPPPAPHPPVKRGGALLGGTALVVALAALGVSGYGLWRDLTAPVPTASVAAADLVPLVARIDALEAQVATLGEQVNPEIQISKPAQIADEDESVIADTTQLDDLNQRVVALESRPAAPVLDLTPLNSRVEGLERVTAELVPRLTMLETRRQMGAAGEGLIVAVGQLQAALAGGRPYARELRAARALVAADTALADLLAPLEATAETGLAGDIALRNQFRTLAPAILRADRQRPDATWTDQVLARMANVITLRRASGEVAGDDVSAIVARAESGLLSGDLPRAVTELETLPAHAAGPAQEWLQMANARIAAEATAATLADMALARMTGTSSTGGEGK